MLTIKDILGFVGGVLIIPAFVAFLVVRSIRRERKAEESKKTS